MSSAVTSGSFCSQPFSHRSALAAAETGTGLYYDAGTDHITRNTPPLSSATAGSKDFHAAWDLKQRVTAKEPTMRNLSTREQIGFRWARRVERSP
ncbi:hypothetical protein [Stieleria sp.]|uniref:hypothetical protein n=1 Tax=Stieleria sp. TaxID=2795976 RepID=UPI0035643C20